MCDRNDAKTVFAGLSRHLIEHRWSVALGCVGLGCWRPLRLRLGNGMILSYAGMTMRVLAIELPLPPHMWVGSAVGIVPLEMPLDRALPVNTLGAGEVSLSSQMAALK